METRSSTPRQSGAVVGHEASAKHQGWRRLNEVGVKSWRRAAFNGAARVTKRKSRSSPPAALPLCRSARTSGGTANYRSVVPQKAFVCSLRHNGKNFHSGTCGVPYEYEGSPNFTPGPEMNMRKRLGMNTRTWRGSIYVWPNKPSAIPGLT